jgi:hypothetical protein
MKPQTARHKVWCPLCRDVYVAEITRNAAKPNKFFGFPELAHPACLSRPRKRPRKGMT